MANEKSFLLVMDFRIKEVLKPKELHLSRFLGIGIAHSGYWYWASLVLVLGILGIGIQLLVGGGEYIKNELEK